MSWLTIRVQNAPTKLSGTNALIGRLPRLRKTEKIDELTRIKERQIELLHEHRAALINQDSDEGA